MAISDVPGHPATATNQEKGPGNAGPTIALHPVLGAGSIYFVGVDTRFDLRAGYLEKLLLFRATRP